MRKEWPLVSVLMTCYNREQFIGEAIASVLASSYSNFELIIVDDASTDQSVAIAEKYAEKDKRIKIFINPKNLGDYVNRNHAASLAKGKYIKYVDSDDRITDKGLAIMVNIMEDNPLAAVGFSTPRKINGKDYPLLINGKSALRKHFLEGGLLEAGPASAIIHLDKFKEVGGFSGKRFVSDYECWLTFCLSSSILFMQPDLMWIRTHKGQENEVGKINYYHLNYNIHKSFLNKSEIPFNKAEKKALLYNYKILLSRRIYQRLLKWYGVKKTWKVIKKCGESPLIFFYAILPMKKIITNFDTN